MARTAAAAKPSAKSKGVSDIDALVSEITETAALIGTHVPQAVPALQAFSNLLKYLAESGDTEDGEDGDDDVAEEEEDEAPPPAAKGKDAKVTAAAKGKKAPVVEEDDEDEESEDDDTLSSTPAFDNFKTVADFLASVGIDITEYAIPAKGPSRTKEAIAVAEGLAGIIESAEADKLVGKGKKTAVDKLIEMLDEAEGETPKRLKKHTDKTYAWLLAAAIQEAESGVDEDAEEDEEEDEDE